MRNWPTASRHGRPIRRRALVDALAALAVCLTVIGGAVACGQGASLREQAASGPPFPPTAAKRSTLRRIADTAASQNGVANPSHVRVFAATRRTALLALRDVSTGGDEPVYVVTMRGDFVAELAPIPPEAEAPRGPMLSLLADPESDVVSVAALSNSVRDLSELGESIPLDR